MADHLLDGCTHSVREAVIADIAQNGESYICRFKGEIKSALWN